MYTKKKKQNKKPMADDRLDPFIGVVLKTSVWSNGSSLTLGLPGKCPTTPALEML